jgi:hypothetical protein
MPRAKDDPADVSECRITDRVVVCCDEVIAEMQQLN